MGKTKCHGRCGRPDVYHRNHALQPMVAGFVEQITEPNNASALPRKIDCQTCCAAREQARHRIQFLSPASQVVACHHKVSGAECGVRRKQEAIGAIQKSMRGCLRHAGWLRRCGKRSRSHRRRYWPQQGERDFLLCERRTGKTAEGQKHHDPRVQNSATPSSHHNFSL